jgi:chromosome segregation ATPase
MTTVAAAERRVAAVDANLGALESRAENLEGLAERTRALGQELQLRQTDLAKATEHLDRASTLREQAASTAHELGTQVDHLSGMLAAAFTRITEINGSMDDLDSRAGNLRFSQKRMAQFEERLAKWEALETHLNRALEHMNQRRTTLDALEADMHRLFEVSEKTVDHVRAIAAAREEVTQTRGMLEQVLGLITHVHQAASELSHRKRQVDQAEERVGRIEALLADMQSSLEGLQAQKALLDHVVEQAGSLAFHTKQAEVLIATLRMERETGEKMRAAIAEARDARDAGKEGRKRTA